MVHLRELITQRYSDSDNLKEQLTAHRAALEYLEPSLDNWNDQISTVLTTVHEGLAHHQGIIDSQTTTLQPLRDELATLIQDNTQAPRVAEIRCTIDNKVQSVH